MMETIEVIRERERSKQELINMINRIDRDDVLDRVFLNVYSIIRENDTNRKRIFGKNK